ncbi:MAG: DNA polymerase III subunit epsilon [Owenweeksia sp.]|nr:DNA polymerase III subunit epsilon [Owenweeksia sp.]
MQRVSVKLCTTELVCIFAAVYCVLDIESTGGPFGKEAIMEIALFRYDGSEIVDQLISLVHPHREVQQYVSKITGITPKMLLRAPRFQEIAKRIVELTRDSVLVGHNVDFDYRMLRQEFARLGYPFEMKTLDTIELAEKLIPGLPAYGLDRICDELGIYRTQKHRAEGDARATLELLQILQEKDKEKDISILGQSIQENDALKDKINDLKRSVKFNKWLYYLHNPQGKILYIGTSDNIKNSLNSLFMTDSSEAEKLRDEVHSVTTEATGNWLIAKVKKEEEMERVKPVFNNDLPLSLDFGVYMDKRSSKPQMTVKPLGEGERNRPLLKAENFRIALRAIRMFRKSGGKDEKAGRLESLVDFPEEAIYSARGRSGKEKTALVVEGGKLVGYFFYSLNDQISHKDKLQKSLVPVQAREEYTELLKLGILSGEFTEIKKP